MLTLSSAHFSRLRHARDQDELRLHLDTFDTTQTGAGAGPRQPCLTLLLENLHTWKTAPHSAPCNVEKAPAADVLPTNGSMHVAYTSSHYAAMLDKALTVHHRGLIDDRTGWHNRPSSSQVPPSLHDLCPFKPLQGIMD